MRRVFFIIQSMLFFAAMTSAQQFESIIQEISFYADVTANAGLAENREQANEKLTSLISKYLSSQEYTDTDMESVAYISVKKPEDNSFLVLTWQYIDHEKEHHYSGYVRTAGGVVHELTSTEYLNPKSVIYEQLDKENWYGALYYNILPTQLNGEKAYLLFGYDGHKDYDHRKVLDVIQIVEGKPVFGGELFSQSGPGQRRPTVYSRLLLEYSNDANVSLNYNEGLGLITYDHLISRMGRNPGQGPTMVPDGSYMGYKWDGTIWQHVEKLYDQVSHEAPTDGRKRAKNRTITGQEKVKSIKKKRG